MNDMTHIVERQRAVQQQVQKADKARPPEEMKGAMQAGARRYPYHLGDRTRAVLVLEVPGRTV